jgi:hypothetical protein
VRTCTALPRRFATRLWGLLRQGSDATASTGPSRRPCRPRGSSSSPTRTSRG